MGAHGYLGAHEHSQVAADWNIRAVRHVDVGCVAFPPSGIVALMFGGHEVARSLHPDSARTQFSAKHAIIT